MVQTPLTFQATDAASPAQTQKAAFGLTVNPSGIAVDVTPHRGGLTLGQTLSLTASVNDGAGVSWSVSPAGGTFSAMTSQSGVAVTFTAPASAGVYTVTATSVTDATRSASMTVGVTDLAGVYTYHNDAARDGANIQEYALTPANVNTHGLRQAVFLHRRWRDLRAAAVGRAISRSPGSRTTWCSSPPSTTACTPSMPTPARASCCGT